MKTSGFTWFKHETLLFNPMNEIEMDVSKKSGFTPDLGTGSMMMLRFLIFRLSEKADDWICGD